MVAGRRWSRRRPRRSARSSTARRSSSCRRPTATSTISWRSIPTSPPRPAAMRRRFDWTAADRSRSPVPGRLYHVQDRRPDQHRSRLWHTDDYPVTRLGARVPGSEQRVFRGIRGHRPGQCGHAIGHQPLRGSIFEFGRNEALQPTNPVTNNKTTVSVQPVRWNARRADLAGRPHVLLLFIRRPPIRYAGASPSAGANGQPAGG